MVVIICKDHQRSLYLAWQNWYEAQAEKRPRQMYRSAVRLQNPFRHQALLKLLLFCNSNRNSKFKKLKRPGTRGKFPVVEGTLSATTFLPAAHTSFASLDKSQADSLHTN
jgi:hypothetical protein